MNRNGIFTLGFCLFLLIIASIFVLLPDTSYSLNDSDYDIINQKHEFYTEQFVFVYNDHNTTTYEGDTGLMRAYANNTLEDNLTYTLWVGNVRGMAYATKGTFKLNDPIIVTHSLELNGNINMLDMWFKNETVIPRLEIEYNNLTSEQKKYFDDYEQQKYEYYQQQQQYALEDMEDSQNSMMHQQEKSNSRHWGFYGGSGGFGYVYFP